jgi:hypothetical protein
VTSGATIALVPIFRYTQHGIKERYAMENYLDLAIGSESIKHQQRRGSRDGYRQMAEEPAPAGLGPDEIEFLEARDSFYMASVN